MKNNSYWLRETFGAVIFFLASLITLSIIRLAFFCWYRTEDAFIDFFAASVMGLRLDAKWLSIFLLLPWALWIGALFMRSFRRAAQWSAVIFISLFILIDLINFGFYGFYGSPINSIIFGLAQDDTQAIIATIWKDWPVLTYIALWIILSSVPCASYHFAQNIIDRKLPPAIVISRFKCLLIIAVISASLGIMTRGSFGTFPLRQQDLQVGTNEFVNAAIPNGIHALYEANKARKMLSLSGDARRGLRSCGFADENEALEILRKVRTEIPAEKQPASQPHVILAIMESMGRDQFDSDSPTNNTLGQLRFELDDAYVFRNGISVNTGTFPSLEGLLFDTPLTPLTQSVYGHKTFDFSRVLQFKKAGYRTIFLTSGAEKWRSIDQNFRLQGFDEIYGAAKILEMHPDAEFSTWGVGDLWTFRYASELMKDADQKGEKLFLVILSATNHPPHHVPDNTLIEPVNPEELTSFIIDDRHSELITSMMKTYQYANTALGSFIHQLRETGILSHCLIAATGDHNARLHYESTGAWHHHMGVPIIFWLPKDNENPLNADTSRWVSHRDIFPTLQALSLGNTPKIWEGRNLFSDESFDFALSFAGFGRDGFAIGNFGAVALDGSSYRCFDWQQHENDKKLIPSTCTQLQQNMGKAGLAERGLADFAVRSGILQK